MDTKKQAPSSTNWEGERAPEEGLERGIALVLRALSKHWLLAASIVIVVCAGFSAYALTRTKIYQASATLQIDPRPPTPLGRGVEGVVELGTASYWDNVEYYNTQHELIASQPVALAAARELGLEHDRRFFFNLPADAPLPTTSEGEAGSELPSNEQAARLIRSRLLVTAQKESRLVDITYEDADPRRAERILSAVLRAYIAHNLDKRLESTSSAVTWLSEQLEGLQKELSQSELALHEYKLEKQIASLGIDDQTSMLKGEMQQLNQNRTAVRAKIQEVAALLAQVKKVDPEEPQSVPQMAAYQTDELAALRKLYLNAKQQYSALLAAGKGQKHPDVLAAQASVEETRRSLSSEIKNIQKGAERELAALRSQEGGLTALLNQAEKSALELNLMEIEYLRLKRTKDNNEKLYSLVLERSKEAGLSQMLNVNNIQLLAEPTAGRSPIKPRLSLLLSFGMVLGLGLGLAGALLRQRLDRSVHDVNELERELGLVSIGKLPLAQDVDEKGRVRVFSRRELDRVVHERPSSAFAEAARALRTNLLFMSPDRAFRRLLVTSSGPSEGKTTVACALALSVAQAGHRVLLIDADLRKPRLHEVFERVSPIQSLSENLLRADRYQADQLGTEILNLSFLPAGPTPPNPSELLHSAAFESLLQRVEEDFDLVILDSPPLLVTDAAILSTQVDGTLLVVRANQSDRRAVLASKRALTDVGGKVLGAVLNSIRYPKRNFRAGYGYGGAYGYGAAYGGGVVSAKKQGDKPRRDAARRVKGG